MNRHLVAVEVGVKGGAKQRVNLDRLAFNQHRLKRLNAEAVKRGGAVEEHRMIFNHLFEDVPNDRILLLNHLFGLLNRGALTGLFQTVINKWLEQLQGHLLRQPALMQLQFGTEHDHGTAGVIYPFSEQVLAEASLLALERVRERL